MLTLMKEKLKFLKSTPSSNSLGFTKNIDFLIHNRIAIQHEYDNLKRVYDRKDLSPKMVNWFIAVCEMQEALHYKNKNKARGYKKQILTIQEKEVDKEKNVINQRINHIETQDDIDDIDSRKKQIIDKIKAVDVESDKLQEKISLDNARTQLGAANMWRLQSRFAIVTTGVIASIFLKYNQFVRSIEMLTQQPIDISILQSPVSAYNVLSVGLFGLRTIVNVTNIVQDMINASDDEKKLISFWERLFIQLDQHEYQFANDLTWMVVNFFTNFPQFLGKFAPFANQIVGVFLIFDVLLTLRTFYKDNKRNLEHQEGNKKLLFSLNQELATIEIQIANFILIREKNGHEFDALLLRKKDIELVITDVCNQGGDSYYLQENMKWKYSCGLAAGFLLLVGFSAAIILSPPMFMPLCFLACNIGIAMYMSGEQAGKMMEKRMIHQIEPSEKTKKEANDELISFGISMIEHTFVPLVIMTVFTMSWPLAIVLTAAYIAAKTGLVSEAKAKIGDELGKIPNPGFFLRDNGYEALENEEDVALVNKKKN